MSYSRRSRYSPSLSPPHKRYGRSVSTSRSRSRSRSYDGSDIENPGNNLYVTGLSARVTRRDLEKHFSAEGKVEDIHLVMDPRTRESRGFGFVSMSNVKEADRCIKYLDGSVLEGRVITVEKARRRRGRTPTPGRYLGLRTARGRGRSRSYSHYSRSRSPCYSSERHRSRSRSYSPYYSSRRRRSYSRGRRSRHHSRSYSPEDCYHRRRYPSRDYSPDYYRSSYRHYRDYSPEYRSSRSRRYRSVSRSVSSSPRRHYRSVSSSLSPVRSRSYSWSISPLPRSSRRSYSPSVSPARSADSRGSFRSASRSATPSKPTSSSHQTNFTPKFNNPNPKFILKSIRNPKCLPHHLIEAITVVPLQPIAYVRNPLFYKLQKQLIIQ
nr:serine/arginine-rich splicing factor SR45A-like isoform X1 [Tanacetum cinerariifolium]